MTGASPPAGQASPPLLHRFLGIGLVLVAASLAIVRHSGVVPLDVLRSGDRVLGYVLSGASVVLLGLAVIVFKPRVPERRPGQSVDQYWSTPEVGARVFPVWSLLEGAGIFSAISYFLTGLPLSAALTVLAVVAFWFMSPNVFAKP